MQKVPLGWRIARESKSLKTASFWFTFLKLALAAIAIAFVTPLGDIIARSILGRESDKQPEDSLRLPVLELNTVFIQKYSHTVGTVNKHAYEIRNIPRFCTLLAIQSDDSSRAPTLVHDYGPSLRHYFRIINHTTTPLTQIRIGITHHQQLTFVGDPRDSAAFMVSPPIQDGRQPSVIRISEIPPTSFRSMYIVETLDSASYDEMLNNPFRRPAMTASVAFFETHETGLSPIAEMPDPHELLHHDNLLRHGDPRYIRLNMDMFVSSRAFKKAYDTLPLWFKPLTNPETCPRDSLP